jgi:hypothetical protein
LIFFLYSSMLHLYQRHLTAEVAQNAKFML